MFIVRKVENEKKNWRIFYLTKKNNFSAGGLSEKRQLILRTAVESRRV